MRSFIIVICSIPFSFITSYESVLLYTFTWIASSLKSDTNFYNVVNTTILVIGIFHFLYVIDFPYYYCFDILNIYCLKILKKTGVIYNDKRFRGNILEN